MTIELKVYDNGDHTCVVWLPSDEKPIPDCLGFTVHRTLKPNGGGAVREDYLHGFVGFSDAEKLDPTAPWKFPIQRYLWSDYGVSPGDVVQYSVVPVCGPDKDHIALKPELGSAQTPPMTIAGQASAHVSAYFNKGIVSAQWVTRALNAVGAGAKLADLIAKPGAPLRDALSGLLRKQVLQLLADAKTNGGEIYAALYELNDPELIPALTALGQKCHLILANGAFKPPSNDENKNVRAQLHGKVDLHDRLVSSGHFAHNKFIVVCDSAGKPQRVLSGSTNWTMTGLCTQANNGIIVEDPALAAFFLNEWNLLKAAGNAYPASLAQANSKQNSFSVDGGTITQWFAPTDKGEDLDYARKLIAGAEQGILFLFFNPGAFEPPDKPEQWTLLQNILARSQTGSPNANPNLYIHGVVNQEIAGLTAAGTAKPGQHAALDPTNVSPVKLYDGSGAAPTPVPYESMVPANIKAAFHGWSSEVMNQGVHVHSKVVVIDPFGKKPVVITGSHNLGYKASTKNDDNMMIVEGNAALAAAYAINIITIYQIYRWNTYVAQHAKDPQVWHGPQDKPDWQNGYLTGAHLAETKFWLGEGASGPAAGGTQVRSSTATGPSPHAGAKTHQPHASKKSAPRKSAPKPARAAHKKSPARKAAAKKAPPAKKAATKSRSAATKRAPAKKKAR